MSNDPLLGTQTLNEALAERVKLSGEKTWLTLYDRDRITDTLTYRTLYEAALVWTSTLRELGVESGDCVMLVLPTNRSFYEAYLGIIFAGCVPVPVYPPVRMSRLEEYQQGLAAQLSNCAAAALVTDERIRPLVRPSLKGLARKVALLTPGDVRINDTGSRCSAEYCQPAAVAPEALGLLQYTSGSTGLQKGVMLTHKNLLENVRAIGNGIGLEQDDVVVTWLPLYHDMGLIGVMLGSLYWGVPLVASSPIDFLRRPVRWLRMLSKHGGTVSAGPNFAYSLLARKAREDDLAGLDLSSWRLALCGAEPIHHTTPERFAQRFAPYGFKAEAFFPAYGLAENTLAVTFSERDTLAHVEHLDQQLLESEGEVVSLPPAAGGKAFVSVGRPVEQVEVAILSDGLEPLGEGSVGEVAVRGPCVMAGYFDNPEATANAIKGGWLLTGDLGFSLEGRYYICGRKKDMVIKAGRNYFAEDLEAAAATVEGLRPGGLCIFSVEDSDKGAEEVVLVAETSSSREGLSEEVQRVVSEATGCRPDRVVLVAPRTVPKTSSGKIQRFKARRWYLDDTLKMRQGDREVTGIKSWLGWWEYAKALVGDLFSKKR